MCMLNKFLVVRILFRQKCIRCYCPTCSICDLNVSRAIAEYVVLFQYEHPKVPKANPEFGFKTDPQYIGANIIGFGFVVVFVKFAQFPFLRLNKKKILLEVFISFAGV